MVQTVVLGDLGVGTLHGSNKYTNVVVVNKTESEEAYEIPGGRDPFYVCKDAFKPAAVLFRCYCLLTTPFSVAEKMADASENLPLGKSLAKNLDVSALAYCAFDIFEKILDVCDACPTTTFYTSLKYHRPHPMYYLSFMAPKILMCQYLSKLWHCNLNLGLDQTGTGDFIKLDHSHKVGFKNWCKALEREYNTSLFQCHGFKLKQRDLKQVVQLLLANDKFGVQQCDQNGLFL